MMDLEKLDKFVSNLPESEKKRAILFFEGKTYSWLEVIAEAKKGTDQSKKLLIKLKETLKE